MSLEMITVDCADPPRLAKWWAAAVGGEVVALSGSEFTLVAREGWPALEVGRLVGLGACETARHSVEGGLRWAVMADPDGNVFCVAAPRA